jgi:hypothetical protein
MVTAKNSATMETDNYHITHTIKSTEANVCKIITYKLLYRKAPLYFIGYFQLPSE